VLDPAAGAAPRVEAAETFAPSMAADAKRILVVDDDPLVLVNTVVMLEELGHAAVEANDAEGALNTLAGSSEFDLVITDHAMPGMTGLALARKLAEERPDLPVLLVSGYADVPDENLTVARLAKPFTLEQLADAVQRQMAQREGLSH
jgi:CheY-like chemotaxis protein